MTWTLFPETIPNTDLFWHWQFWEVWDVSGPFNGAEEKSSCQFTDAVDAHDGCSAHRCLHLSLAVVRTVAAAGVGLCPQELRDEIGNRLPVEVIQPDVTRSRSSRNTCQWAWTDARVSWRYSTPLDGCRNRSKNVNVWCRKSHWAEDVKVFKISK